MPDQSLPPFVRSPYLTAEIATFDDGAQIVKWDDGYMPHRPGRYQAWTPDGRSVPWIPNAEVFHASAEDALAALQGRGLVR